MKIFKNIFKKKPTKSDEHNRLSFKNEFKFIISFLKLSGVLVIFNENSKDSVTKSIQSDLPIVQQKTEKSSKKKISIYHLIYCILLNFLKIIMAPAYLLGLILIPGYRKYSFSCENCTESNNLRMSNSDSSFLIFLLKTAHSLFCFQLILLTLVHLSLSIFGDFLTKTGHKMEETELILDQYINNYNDIIKNINPLAIINCKRLKPKKVVYMDICFIGLFMAFFIRYLIKYIESLSQDNFTLLARILSISLIVGIALYTIDLLLASLLYGKLIMIGVYQFNRFLCFFKNVIDNFYQNSAEIDLDAANLRIEDIRILYNHICSYIFEIDSWMCLVSSIIYFTSIPSICLYAYSLSHLSYNIETEKILITIVFFLFQMFGLIFYGIWLNMKVFW